MAEHEHGHDHDTLFRSYMVIAGCLAGFTTVSFLCNYMAREQTQGGLGWISVTTSFVIILGVAVVKATLVGLYFMHVKWDWRNLYFIIFPIFILAVMMMFVLMPDGVFAWKHEMVDFPKAVSIQR